MKRIAILLLGLALIFTGLSFLSEDANAVQTTGPPGTPTGTAGYGFIDVSWSAAPGSPANYYVYWSVVRGTGPGLGVEVSGTTQGPVTTHRVSMGGLPDYPSPLPAHYGLYFQICSHYAGGVGDAYSAWTAVPYYSGDYPGIPQNLQGSPSSGNAVLTWAAPVSNGGVALTNYHIYRSTTSGAETELGTVSGSTLTYTDTTVAGGQTYYYKVAADNGYTGTQTGEISVAMPAGKPGVVTNLQGVSGDDGISLTWTAPAANGGSPITHYNVFRSTVSGNEEQIGSSIETACTFLDGSPELGETYYFQVTAVNAVGDSARCTEIEMTYIKVPTAPLDLQASVGPGQIHLTWSAPADNGGHEITYYDIYRLNVTAGGDWEWYSWTEGERYFDDTNVWPGCTYQYDVMAWNDYNEGPASEDVEVTYSMGPSAPFNVNLAPGAGTMLVSWNEPNTTGGSEIVGYWVFWGTSPGSRTEHASAGLQQSYTIHGLQDDTTYYISVAANNTSGQGAFSAEVHAQTPTFPGVVEELMGVRGDGSVSLSWLPPTFNGNSGITYYSVYRGTSAMDEDTLVANVGSDCAVTDTGLINGHTYYYAVTANNAVGAGPAVEYSIVPATTPGSPANVHAAGGFEKITLTWSHPVDMGGGILHYQIYRGSSWGDATLVDTIGNVTTYDDTVGMNDTWSYWVVADNWAGAGSRSGSAQATAFSMPQLPTGLTAQVGDSYVNLTWTAPTFTGNTPLTEYLVYRSTDSGAEEFLASAGLHLYYNDTTALNGQTYFYKVRASNGIYAGGLCAEISGVPHTVPDQPLGVIAFEGYESIMVWWLEPGGNGGDAIDGYLLSYYTEAGGWAGERTLGNVLSYTYTGLLDNTTYNFVVRAHNSAGYGPASNPAYTSTFGVPYTTVLAQPERADSTVHLSWTATPDGGSPVTAYRVFRSESSGDMSFLANAGTDLSYDDTTAINGHTYHYRVAAVNIVGTGAASNEVTMIPARAPGAPTGLTVEGDKNAMHLAWTAPADMGGGIQHYLVYRGDHSGGESLIATIDNVTSFTDTGLGAGSERYYRVAAENWGGIGPVTAEGCNSTMTMPAAPGSFAVEGLIGHTHLSWQTSTDGNSPLLGYRVYRSTVSGTEVRLADLGLVLVYDDYDVVNGTTYFYSVTASNAGYESFLSAEASGKPFDVPSVPTDVQLTAGVRNITVVWSAPANDNGAAVTGYLVSIRVQGSGESVVYDVGLLDRYTIINLDNATAYTVSVAAYNAAGNGPAGSSASTTCAPPSAVVSSVSSGDAWARISWTAPSSDSPLLGYKLYKGTAADALVLYQTLGPVEYFNDTALVNGQAYCYKVVAFSLVGDGTGNVVITTPSTIPGEPTGLTVVVGTDGVTLSWTAPADDGGSPITSYTVYRSAGGVEVSFGSAGTSIVDQSAVRGTEYTYRVVAVNAVGAGPYTPSSDPAVPGTTASAVTGMHAVAGIGNVTLSWSAPADNGGFTVTGYKVLRGTSLATVAQIATVSVPGYLDLEAASGSAYLYQIVAVNAKGDGAAVSLTVTSLNQPTQPSSVTVTRQGSGALVTWSEDLGDQNASSVTGYAIYRDTGSGWELVGTVNGSSVSSFNDTDVPSGAVQYKVVGVGMDGLAGFSSASGSIGTLAASGNTADILLPGLALLSLAAILILFFVVAKRRKKKDGQ